jgi:hypothetical protein
MKEIMSHGLKPKSIAISNVRAEARTYLRNKDNDDTCEFLDGVELVRR